MSARFCTWLPGDVAAGLATDCTALAEWDDRPLPASAALAAGAGDPSDPLAAVRAAPDPVLLPTCDARPLAPA
jgi:hypothetical protein